MAGIELTWITDNLAVGGGIWTEERMGEIAGRGITHIIDMQVEFDDTELGHLHGVQVLWNPIDDDFQLKSPEMFQRGVQFALSALADPKHKLYIHCAAGVHRGPMMALAIMCSMGWKLREAQQVLRVLRPIVDLPDVYLRSVEQFLRARRVGALK